VRVIATAGADEQLNADPTQLEVLNACAAIDPLRRFSAGGETRERVVDTTEVCFRGR